MLMWLSRQTRRLRTGFATNFTADDHNAWVSEQVAAYATPQPYAAPLTNSADNWTGETWEMREGYRRFAVKEPSVKAALLTKCLAVAQLDLQVIADDKRDQRSREVAAWVKYAIGQCDGGIAGLVWKILIHSLVDGFSVTEKVNDQLEQEHPKYPGYWIVGGAKTKDSRGIRFRLDRFKNVVGVRSMIAAQGGMEFSPEDFIIFTHLPLFENPFGISDLRAANRAANLIEAAIKLRAILLENFSGPYLKAKSDDNGVRSKLHETLSKARARGYIIVGRDDEVEVMNLATSAPDQFQSAIEDLRREIVTAIQGAYLQLLEGGVSDGRGNTNVHKGVAELFQWWLATCVSNVLNKSLVPDLVRPNYGYGVGLPTIQLGGVDTATVVAELDRFAKGQSLGVKLSAKQVSEVGGFETPEDEADILTPPGQQQQPQPGGDPGGAFPDLGDLFGGDDEGGAAGDTADPFPGDGSDAEFSEREFADMSMADRSHLVKKVITDVNGQHRVVYVNPHKGEHGSEAQRMEPRDTARAAVTNAIARKGQLSKDELAALPGHLKTLTKAEKQGLVKQLGLHVSDDKKAIAERILAYVQKKPQPKRPEGPDSLYKAVRRFGGIDPKSLAFLAQFKGVNEAMQNGVSLGLFKVGGRGLDQMAQELHNVGYIQQDDPQHLIDQLRKGTKSSYQASDVNHDDALSAYYAAQQAADDYAKSNPKASSRVKAAKAKAGNATKKGQTYDDVVPFADITPAAGAPDPVDVFEDAAATLVDAARELARAKLADEVMGVLADAVRHSQ